MREKGLISYSPPPPNPSPLLGRLLVELPDVVAKKVLPLLDPADVAVLAQVGRPWLAAVLASELPRAGKEGAAPLKLAEFVGSVERLAWAKANGCPWTELTCALIAKGGLLELLRWAREHGCPWDEATSECAAAGGHLDVLQWARAQEGPLSADVCGFAAEGGHMQLLQWAREQGCPWDAFTSAHAALGGRLQLLQWLWEHGCPWDEAWTSRHCPPRHPPWFQRSCRDDIL